MIYTNSLDGFEAEFAHLVKEHERYLQIFAFRVTKCEQLAKDVVQDVFLKLWEHRAQYHEIENIQAWLYRVTENKLIDLLRKTAADKRLRQKTWNSIREITNETEMNLVAKESGQFISRAVNKLPEQRKIIYKLNREQFLDYNQIARFLRISRHTVKNQISLALHNLRDQLKNLRLF
jgi:RNA polymerase sigma-70 factor (ECF subfamily)